LLEFWFIGAVKIQLIRGADNGLKNRIRKPIIPNAFCSRS
jgi:hypothetical protein